MRQRAVFLDRDGVIIENRDDYCKSWAEVEFLPGALEALRRLSVSDRAIVIVTNQSAVGRGLLSAGQAHAINAQLIEAIQAHGGRIDAAYICPHHPDEACRCRKPAPGLFLRAAEELGVTLAEAWMIGDAATDVQAAHAIGARGILVRTGRGVEQSAQLRGMNGPIVEDLRAAVNWILERDAIQEKISGRELVHQHDEVAGLSTHSRV